MVEGDKASDCSEPEKDADHDRQLGHFFGRNPLVELIW